VNTFRGLFRPLHAGGLLAASAIALTLCTALPTEATTTRVRHLAGATGVRDHSPEAVSVSEVYCPEGMIVQSGGYATTNGDTSPDRGEEQTLLASHPVFDAAGRKGWYASASHADVTAHVLCLPAPRDDYQVGVVGPVVARPGALGRATAVTECPERHTVAAGGFRMVGARREGGVVTSTVTEDFADAPARWRTTVRHAGVGSVILCNRD
jgi:hypothetical protein